MVNDTLQIINSKETIPEESEHVDMQQSESSEREKDEAKSKELEKEIQNTMEMCHELESLSMTLKGKNLGTEDNFIVSILYQIRNINFEPYLLSNQATGIIKFIATYNTEQRRELELEPKLCSLARLDLTMIEGPRGSRDGNNMLTKANDSILEKRMAPLRQKP